MNAFCIETSAHSNISTLTDYKVYDENAKLDPSYYLLATEDKKGLGILGIDMMGFAKDPLWYLHITFGSKFCFIASLSYEVYLFSF